MAGPETFAVVFLPAIFVFVMKQRLKKISAYFLLAVFFISFTPKELIHAVVCHHEEAKALSTNDAAVSKSVVKCIFLQQHFESFTSAGDATVTSSPFSFGEKIIIPAEIIFLQR